MRSKTLALPLNLFVDGRREDGGHEADFWAENTPTCAPRKQPSLGHGQIPEIIVGLGL